MTPLLSVRGVCTFYGKIQALRNVDLDVADGEEGAHNPASASTFSTSSSATPR